MKIRFLSILLLAGCQPTYGENLAQQLQSKTPEERRLILARECGQELKRGYAHAETNKAAHYGHMRYICETITGHDVYNTGP